MLAVLSPAKSLDLSAPQIPLPTSEPALMGDAATLMRTTRGLTQKRIRELMDLSADLAKLNYDRFHEFDLPFREDNAHPAAIAFNGDVYRGLDARSLSSDDLTWAQDRIAILSGLFGLLRPLDLIQPYRLEMGTRLKTRRGANLYSFWGDKIATALRSRLDEHADKTLVNLASNEYFKAARAKTLDTPVVECVFEDWKTHPEEGRVVGFLAKYARGMMARYIITNRIDRAEDLKDFNQDRYVFQPDRSTDTRWVFTRKFIPVEASRAAE
jgi:cytoplasmic iron level regulating protein YaaA (DUF328/UPF0246 family)